MEVHWLAGGSSYLHRDTRWVFRLEPGSQDFVSAETPKESEDVSPLVDMACRQSF